MSYQVLARKWRPATFKDVVGQNSVVRILTNALKENRLHPALIFAGPRGTGKTSTARVLAKTLSCPQIKNLIPCNNCKTCQDIDESRSLDVIEIDGASHNGVEAVRQLKETVTYLPAGPYKIYIIDEAHMLSISAFNALLKTLEEPPSHALFIMATTEMKKIPPTVLSRCQILSFRQIADDIIYKQLKKIAEVEKAKAEDGALWILAQAGRGSLRDAQGLLDHIITFCPKNFDQQDVSEILGLTDRHLLMDTLKSLIEKKPDQVLKNLILLHEKGEEPLDFLQSLIKELRNLLLLKFSTSDSLRSLVPLSKEEKTKLLKWGEAQSPEDIHLLLDMSLKGSWEMNRLKEPKIFLEILLLKMSQAPHIEQIFGGVSKKAPPEKEQEKANQPPPLNNSTSSKGPEINTLKKEDSSSQTQNKIIKADKTLKLHKTQNKSTKIQENVMIQQIQTLFSADILETREPLSTLKTKAGKIDKALKA